MQEMPRVLETPCKGLGDKDQIHVSCVTDMQRLRHSLYYGQGYREAQSPGEDSVKGPLIGQGNRSKLGGESGSCGSRSGSR